MRNVLLSSHFFLKYLFKFVPSTIRHPIPIFPLQRFLVLFGTDPSSPQCRALTVKHGCHLASVYDYLPFGMFQTQSCHYKQAYICVYFRALILSTASTKRSSVGFEPTAHGTHPPRLHL